ncbi:addiction module toxin RelE [Mucilaginibacter sp. JRF]|uniref:addiction module toxin RelE n=1 Tax=Mucilaginibacter sp. JRF TaxID=2780088 RepID=UPI00187E5F10|nr:addiction module toxin RelE [Mucilaginibacter sp. JRF]MBE9584344.1 addiction module toxin RelE [Mucilaginibacter sp. JRF]
MNNSVFVSAAFKREVKPLAKKYKSLKESLDKLVKNLTDNPYLGDAYGHDIFKVRLADPSKGVGKRGGFRVMYYHLQKTEDGIQILMMSIYDKSERSTIKKADAIKILDDILKEHNAGE